MRTLIIVINLMALLQLQAAMVAQFSFNNHTYQIFDDLKSWDDARTDARGRTANGTTGYLAEINSAEEDTTILNALLDNDSSFTQTAGDGGGARYVWIGANDNQIERTWVWDNSGINFWTGAGHDGSPQDGRYSNWGGHAIFGFEPDDFGSQDAGAIALDNWPVGNPGQWNDINGANTMPYVVEYNAVPEPTQIALGLGLSSLLLCLRSRRQSQK